MLSVSNRKTGETAPNSQQSRIKESMRSFHFASVANKSKSYSQQSQSTCFKVAKKLCRQCTKQNPGPNARSITPKTFIAKTTLLALFLKLF